MINNKSNFFKDVERHQANAEDLDKYLEFWHNTQNLNISICDFLGCSEEQYALLVEGMPVDNWVHHVLNSKRKPINFQNLASSAKELYEFDASNLGGDMFYHDYVVFHHGDTLYSVRNTKTGVISLTKADCAMNAIEKVENPASTETIKIKNKLVSELNDTQSLLDDNHDQLSSNPSTKDVARLMKLSMKTDVLKELIDFIDNIDGGREKSEKPSNETSSNDSQKDYSDFELWAYEWYKLQWSIDRGVLPNDVDSEVGINGGECFACLNEFLDNEFNEHNLYYQKVYFLTQLLLWIKSEYLPNGAFIMENRLKMSIYEIWTYANERFSNKLSYLDAYKAVIKSHHFELMDARVDEIIRSALNFIKSENGLSDFIVDFFVYNTNEAGIDIEYLNHYIDVGFITHNELYSRNDNLDIRSKKAGAEFVFMPYTDGVHLHCFWYPQGLVAYITYKGYVAEFFVQGDVDAHLYDKDGYIMQHITHSTEAVGLREDLPTLNVIQNDTILTALEDVGKLEFFVQPWVELVIRDQMTNRVIKKQWVNDNILAAVEENFDDIIKTIDKITNVKKENKND